MKKEKHKYTMNSSVRTLSIKCYNEQLADGWASVSARIRAMDKSLMYVIGICHNLDHTHDDIWGSALDKPHFHIIVKVLNNKQKSVGSILNALGIVYRRGLDDILWDNHGVETVRDFSAMTTYMTHETEQAMLDGKTIYSLDDLVSNLNIEEIKHIRLGYSRISAESRKYSIAELAMLDEQAYALGYELGDFDAWYASQAFAIRANAKIRTIEESYYRGVRKRVDEHIELVRLCVFIKGEPNTGKSYAAESALSAFRKLKVSGGGSGKFDNLKPWTEAVIIDDDICPNLLNISDNYMTSVYRRNRNNPIWAGQYFIVTSNLDFDSWLLNCGIGREHFSAMHSRFYLCEIQGGEKNRLFCTSPSMRGNNEQQNIRKKRYIEFRNAYNQSLSEYVPSMNIVDYGDINA